MTNPVDQEIEAIKSLMTVLSPLDAKARQAALDYVLKRLDIKLENVPVSPAGSALPPGESAPSPSTDGAAHIKAFKEAKKPKSATEMAALVAYYLAHKSTEKRQTITAKDVQTQFQIAEFPLPGKPQFTLPNAKNAGYLDAAGNGEYKLNPVGYNLIVHSLPRKDGAAPRQRNKTPRTRKTNRKPR